MFCPNCGKQIPNLPCPHCSTDSSVSNTVNSTNATPKKKSNKKFLLLGVIIVVIAVLVFLGVSYFLKSKSSSKEVFDKTIGSVIKEVKRIIPSTNESISETYSFKAELDLNKYIISPEYYAFVKNLEIKGSTVIDFKNKQIALKVSPLYKEESLLDLAVYGVDNNIYANIGDLFSKYIKVPVDADIYNNLFKVYSEQNLKDINTILSEIEIGLTKSLKEEYFNSEKETLTIENKEVDVVKHTLILDEKTTMIIAKDLLTYLNNDKFLESAERFTKEITSNMNEDEIEFTVDIKNGIEEAIKNLEETIEQGEFNETKKILISIFLDSSNCFTCFTVGLEEDNLSEQLFVDVIKMADKKYSFEFTNTENLKVVYGTLSMNNTENNYEVYLNSNDDSIGVVKFNINTLMGTTNISNISISNDNIGTIKLILTNSSSNKAQITMPDFINLIDYTELTEEDLNGILLKIMEKDSINQFITDIQPLLDMINS